MRHPLWILNSSLLLLLLVCVGFIVFTQKTLPKKIENKKSNTARRLTETESTPIDITKIYENDIFDTYHEAINPATQPDYVNPIPTPPSPSSVEIPEDPVIPFLPPLQVSLKGIMIVNDESKNVAVIEDNATRKEENYKIGDSVEDAQLIRILYNKVILVRSNGQFETLYLSEKDITNQALATDEKDNWKDVVLKKSEYLFDIDPVAFVDAIPGLSQFIDMFDVTTIYKKGLSVGCRIGSVTAGSLAHVLGLQSQDILRDVAGISTATPDQRYEIYEKITQLKIGSSFTVELERDGRIQSLGFTLVDLQNPLSEPLSDKPSENEGQKVGILKGPSAAELEEERVKALEERYKFAQTAQDILIEQRRMMTENKEAEKTVSLLNEA